MKYLIRRRYHKLVKHVLHEARHARHMREDVTSPADLAALQRAEESLLAAWGERDAAKIDAAVQSISDRIVVVQPPRSYPRLREYIEIIAVAVAVAMGFRTYFIQPFKIPTGSMQPTLYGITVKTQVGKKWNDHFPINLVGLALFGDRYIEIKARASGLVSAQVEGNEDSLLIFVAGQRHVVPRDMPLYVRPGQTMVNKGQILAAGRHKLGDHIFVNKLRYYFRRPERGDIFVFSTRAINYPRIRPDSFYIKRLAGLPGEALQIDPPYLMANGQRVTEPYPFKRMVEATAAGYHGYQLPRNDPGTQTVLGSRDTVYTLADDEYLPLGDNTGSSLDGRYFGAVNRNSVVGPAFAIYWPLSRRWGLVQ
jgi:signal peptidase I